MSDLQAHIRTVPDFPKKGIGFKDITTLLKSGAAFHEAVDAFDRHYSKADFDKIVGIESRGFIFGAALAYHWSVGFVPVRKPGKLPAATISQEYELEYGIDQLEIHEDAISRGERALIIDDLLATGGTAQATVELVERLGGEAKHIAFLIELTFLHGRDKLRGHDVFSIMELDSE